MAAQVILTATNGKLAGQTYHFDQPTSCLIGRSSNCDIRVPATHSKVSRSHCHLEINPPTVRIRDLGSRYGTYVNGQKIGQREPDETLEKQKSPQYNLQTGDTIKIGDITFQVEITKAKSGQSSQSKSQNTVQPIRNTTTPTQGQKTTTVTVGAIPQSPSFQGNTRKKKNFFLNFINRLINKAIGVEALQGYEIAFRIGEGGFGEVFLARHEKSGDLVAIKVMLPAVAADEVAVKRFQREIESTKILNHPHIVSLIEYGYFEGMFYFAMEYCEGGSLHDYLIRQGKPLSLNEAISIILQALDALDYAHKVDIPSMHRKDGKMARGKGLVHRDINPRNILIASKTQPLTVKLADFGTAKAFDLAGLSGLSLTDIPIGTPQFMPRQQVIEMGESSPALDVWSTAATLYYLLTGQFPREFTGGDGFIDILQNDAIPIQQRNGGIPDNLAQVIDLALQEEPQIYYQSAQDFKHALMDAM